MVCTSLCKVSTGNRSAKASEIRLFDGSDIGGLDKQIQELVEAIVLPMQMPERFETIGIRPPKGELPFLMLCGTTHILLTRPYSIPCALHMHSL